MTKKAAREGSIKVLLLDKLLFVSIFNFLIDVIEL